jgi:hypothetical protein
MSELIAKVKLNIPKRFRLLKPGEVVKPGDFVANDRQEFELWEGPTGFLADAFVKPIYRKEQDASIRSKELE